MQGGILSLGLVAALAIALLIAAWTDLKRREIGNWLNAAIAIGAPLFWMTSGFDLFDAGIQVVMAILVFVLLLALFSTGLMGGGDVKLLTALALWVTPVAFVKLLVWMSVAGGILTLICFAWHYWQKRVGKIAVPYGIAISFAGLWILASEYLPTFGIVMPLNGT